MRLKDKVAVVIGAGQGPGEGMGNGRATAIRFAQEGAKVLAVDNRIDSAEETASMARQHNGECAAFQGDVTREASMAAAMAEAKRRFGRVDIMHYNVGVSLGGGAAP
jgi:NAD(P)-dependent dehydrogenase (short-subunit alcohol dehydrogenase family)